MNADDNRFKGLHRAYQSLCTNQTRKIWESKSGLYQHSYNVEENGTALCKYHLKKQLQYSSEDVALTLHDMAKLSSFDHSKDRQCSFGHFVQAAWNVKESPESAEKEMNRARAWVEILHSKCDLNGNGFLSFDYVETGGLDSVSEWDLFFFAVQAHPALGLPQNATAQGLLAIALSLGAMAWDSPGGKHISAEEAFIVFNAAKQDPETLARESLRQKSLLDTDMTNLPAKGGLPPLRP